MNRPKDAAATAHYGRFERAQENAAYEGLRELILTRRIPVGQPIDFAGLSDELDVEVEQLHAAVVRLRSEFLVTRDDDGAFLASPLTVEMADGLFDARTVIEIGVIEARADSIAESDLQVLEKLARELAEIVAEPMPDLGRFLEASHDYHSYLVGLARSAPLTAAYLKLGISRLWRASIADLDWWNLFDVSHHSQLSAALRAGDRARAKDLIYEHQAQVKGLVLQVIAGRGGVL